MNSAVTGEMVTEIDLAVCLHAKSQTALYMFSISFLNVVFTKGESMVSDCGLK